MGAVGRQHPRSRAPASRDARDSRGKAACVQLRSAEAFSSAVKHSVPWSSRTEPKTPWDVHAVKAVE